MMKEYLFKTYATMKPYNRDKWFICSDIIHDFVTDAESLRAALNDFVEHCSESCVEVSKHALKTRQPMYRDYKDGTTRQVGFVITASSDFNDNYRRWCKQYIDLWVEVATVESAFNF